MKDRKHTTTSISDKVALIAELEHTRRHALRSMISNDIPQEDRIFYAVLAEKAKETRRKLMEQNFPECPNELWCLGKSTACLRQLSYELFSGDDLMVREIDEIVDMVWEKITGEDLSDCESCKSDRDNEEAPAA